MEQGRNVRQPNNPATRDLDAIRQANYQSGAPLGSSPGTVLPPLPVPLDDEGVGVAPTEGALLPEPPLVPSTPVLSSPPSFTGFDSIDLVKSMLVTNTGERFEISEGDMKSLNVFCIEVMNSAVQVRLGNFAKQMGLTAEDFARARQQNVPSEDQGEGEKVPEVPTNETPGPVSKVRKGGRKNT